MPGALRTGQKARPAEPSEHAAGLLQVAFDPLPVHSTSVTNGSVRRAVSGRGSRRRGRQFVINHRVQRLGIVFKTA